MNDIEIRALSQQLAPLALEIRKILEWPSVPLPAHAEVKTPGYDHKIEMFTFGADGRGSPFVGFGNLRPQPGAALIRRFDASVEHGIEPVEATTKSWDNPTDIPVEVKLEETVAVREGVQSVETDAASYRSSWEVGGSVQTRVETSAKAPGSFMGTSVEASAAASAEVDSRRRRPHPDRTGVRHRLRPAPARRQRGRRLRLGDHRLHHRPPIAVPAGPLARLARGGLDTDRPGLAGVPAAQRIREREPQCMRLPLPYRW